MLRDVANLPFNSRSDRVDASYLRSHYTDAAMP